MLQYFRCLLAEFKKRNRSLFLLLHLAVPLIIAGTLVAYISVRKHLLIADVLYKTFFEMLGVGTPLVIAIICGIVSDSEQQAGNFQNMLKLTKFKGVTFISQISMMVISYLFSVLLAIIIYTLSLKYLIGYSEINFSLYIITGIIFTVCAIFQYFFYQILGYKYGLGTCSIGGFAGLIISAMALTSIGDKVWRFLPWSWSNRFSLYLYNRFDTTGYFRETNNITNGYICWFIFTFFIIIFSILWFKNWSGRRAEY